jgi:hypothetical protein
MARAVIIDRGWLRIKTNMAELQGQGVKVGIRSTAGQVDGVRIVDYATFNEFGTSRIPSRPFMRRTADQAKSYVPDFAKRLTKGLIEQKITVNQLFNQLGLFYQDKIRKTILSSPSWAVPNSPITIKRKKSSVPLVDTGAMVGAVDYERTRI